MNTNVVKRKQFGDAPEQADGKLLALQRALNQEVLSRRINAIVRTETCIETLAQEVVALIGKALNADRCLLYSCLGEEEAAEDHRCPLLAEYYQSSLQEVEEGDVYFNANQQVYDSLHTREDVLVIEEPVSFLASPRSMMATGTFVEGRVNGIICVQQSLRERQWQAHEISLLESAARDVALALERVRSTQKLMEMKDNLEKLAKELACSLKKEKEITVLQSQFISMASHELRTPLAVISSCLQLLSRKRELSEDNFTMKQFSKIDRAVHRMTLMVGGTLSLARLEAENFSFSPRPVNIRQLIEGVVARQKDFDKACCFEMHIDDALVTIWGDSELLDLALANLVSNAVKYSGEKATIVIECCNQAHGLEIRVADNGSGIEEGDLPHIFDKFYRAKNAIGIAGTGIGLHLVKTIVEKHQGKVSVTSEVGKGTTFSLFLPGKVKHIGEGI